MEDVTLSLAAPEGWTVERVLGEGETDDPAALNYNGTVSATFTVTAPEDAASYNPYRRHIRPLGANGLVYGVVDFSAHGVERRLC